LAETVLDLAKKQGAVKVLEVYLRIGKLRVISIDQLTFSYQIIAKGTALEGSRLTIEETTGSVKCLACNYTQKFEPDDLSFHFGIPPMTCPTCGANLILDGGDECIITKIRMLAPSAATEARVVTNEAE
jgi:hydrogenase nickel incorporation protein HypA/HybF